MRATTVHGRRLANEVLRYSTHPGDYKHALQACVQAYRLTSALANDMNLKPWLVG